jgi:hypothetical protein
LQYFLGTPLSLRRSSGYELFFIDGPSSSDGGGDSDARKITTFDNTDDKKPRNQSNFGQFDGYPINNLDYLIPLAKKVVRNTMLDNRGHNKGYFTKDDHIYIMQMLANERWTEDRAKRVFNAFVNAGLVREITERPGKFEPTEKLSGWV